VQPFLSREHSHGVQSLHTGAAFLAEYMNSALPTDSIGAYCSSQLRKLLLTSKDRGLFLCAKDSGFLSLMAQSSHHLWQKDGWQQD